MPALPFYWIDAFTSSALGGNPCAVILDADSVSEQRMQALAREMGLSETAFVMKSSRADFRARFFTPEQEIPLAGHPTIAAFQALLESGRASRTLHTLELQAGVVEVSLEPGPPARITMSQLAPRFMRIYPPEAVLPAFGLQAEDSLPEIPIQTVSTGTPQLMIPVKSLDVLRRLRVNVERYRALRESGDFFSPHLFCLQGISNEAATFARHPGIAPDTLEDPFTGSATGNMGAYLWRHGLISTPRFVAQQGHWMGRPGQAEVEIIGPPENIQTVRVTGSAVTLVRGALEIY